jgi:hypothetical protein
MRRDQEDKMTDGDLGWRPTIPAAETPARFALDAPIREALDLSEEIDRLNADLKVALDNISRMMEYMGIEETTEVTLSDGLKAVVKMGKRVNWDAAEKKSAAVSVEENVIKKRSWRPDASESTKAAFTERRVTGVRRK